MRSACGAGTSEPFFMGNFGTEWLDVADVLAQSASGATFKPHRDLRFFLPTLRDEIFRLVGMSI
jgi:hypothetical protein